MTMEDKNIQKMIDELHYAAKRMISGNQLYQAQEIARIHTGAMQLLTFVSKLLNHANTSGSSLCMIPDVLSFAVSSCPDKYRDMLPSNLIVGDSDDESKCMMMCVCTKFWDRLSGNPITAQMLSRWTASMVNGSEFGRTITDKEADTVREELESVGVPWNSVQYELNQ